MLLNNHNQTVELTPAQVDFCSSAIDHFEKDDWIVSIAGKAGSDRRFLRLQSKEHTNKSSILILWDSQDADWERFFSVYQEVTEVLPALPTIYAYDKTHGLILEEDCGSVTLKEYCTNNDKNGNIVETYKKVIDRLITWQRIKPQSNATLGSRILDKEMLLWETDYFAAHCVSDYFGLDAQLTPLWDHEKNRLAASVAALPLVCIHRDFQSENIMLTQDRIVFVDYQGARLGPAEYDLASLLFDPYVDCLSESDRRELFEYYIAQSNFPMTLTSLHSAAMQRLCQALGAYGNLSLHKGKQQYTTYIPRALDNLASILVQEPEYPILNGIVTRCRQRLNQ